MECFSKHKHLPGEVRLSKMADGDDGADSTDFGGKTGWVTLFAGGGGGVNGGGGVEQGLFGGVLGGVLGDLDKGCHFGLKNRTRLAIL